MKKITFFLLLSLVCNFVSAQVVTTEPAFIIQGYTGTVKIIFDPTLGDGGMIDATECYAHTGVSTTDGLKWQCAPKWRNVEDKHKMTKVGTKWELTIDDMYDYYNCETVAGKTFSELCFVFNDGPDGEFEGKAEGGKDIFVTLYESGINVKFDIPEKNKLVLSGNVVEFKVTASEDADLVLKINGDTKKSESGTTLIYSETFSDALDYTCIIEASAGGLTVRDTVYLCVPTEPILSDRPSGVVDGINYYENDHGKVTLVMYAKDRDNNVPDNIFVIGDFNNWAYGNTYQMKKEGNSGYWWITLDNLIDGKEYAFQYAVKMGDEVIQISDAYAEKVLDPWEDAYIPENIYPGLTYPEKVADGLVSVFQTNKPKFDWSNETINFKRPNRNNLVIYEMWIHDFSVAHSIKAATDRLDYLESLGVNVIELMPIMEFDGNISWGYNPNHFLAADKAYGTSNDYKTFIDECHKRGIAVVLDIAMNHSTGNHPFAKLYWNGKDNVTTKNPWYNYTAPHPDSVNQDFDHGFTGTRDYFKRVLQYWIEEYKVDGYRVDLAHGVCGLKCSNQGDRETFLFEYFNAAKENGNDDILFILEFWDSYDEQVNYTDWGMLCWSNMNKNYSQATMGWLTPYGDRSDDFSNANKKNWVSYTESHDEERNLFEALENGNGNLKTNETARLQRVPLITAMNALLDGPKMLWQFQEIGYDYSIMYGGDRLTKKPIPDTLGWYKNQNRMAAYGNVAKAIQLRTRILPEVFIEGRSETKMGSGWWVRSVTWYHANAYIHVVGNYAVSGGTEYSGSAPAPIPEGTWYDYLNDNAIIQGGKDITLQPSEFKILINKKVNAPDIPGEFEFPSSIKNKYVDETDCIVYPTFVNDVVYIESKEPVKNVRLMSVRGETVKSAKGVTRLNVSGLPKGMYLMIVSFDKHQAAFKIIKQ